ncbi:MAG: LysR family transcriptional regulator [Hyphomonadaceae bacterium]|nr:LysR family transcriptional regulator [Hyphomonadaceae bacterium]
MIADLNLLTAFDALMETRSVSKAAVKIGVGQPAMSAALARLRDALGDPLFVRVGGRMEPTARARDLAPKVAQALALIRDSLNAEARFEPGRTERTFTVASTDYTSFVLAPMLAARFTAAAPRATLRLIGYDKDDVGDLLDKGLVDVALGVFRNAPPHLLRKLLCKERFVGAARANHPALRDGAITLEAYLACDHALVSVRRDAIGEIDTLLAARGLARRIALTLPHMASLPAILRATDLLAALPSRLAEHAAEAGLALFELPIAAAGWRIEMLYPAAGRSDRAQMWLRGLIAQAA